MLTASNEEGCHSEPNNKCQRFSLLTGFYNGWCSPPTLQVSARDCPGCFTGFYRQWDSVSGADKGAGHACVKDFLNRTTCSERVWGTPGDIAITIALVVLATSLLVVSRFVFGLVKLIRRLLMNHCGRNIGATIMVLLTMVLIMLSALLIMRVKMILLRLLLFQRCIVF